jgi:two-component system sensor histidine kinase KdpD
VYVQTPDETADRIDSTVQRHLVDNIQMAQTLGAEVVKLTGEDVAATLCRFAEEKGVSLMVVGQSTRSKWHKLRHGSVVESLVNNKHGIDVFVASFADSHERNGRVVDPARSE